MKLEEVIVFLLADSGHGIKTEQLAREISGLKKDPFNAGKAKMTTEKFN